MSENYIKNTIDFGDLFELRLDGFYRLGRFRKWEDAAKAKRKFLRSRIARSIRCHHSDVRIFVLDSED